jgi:AcrR family transcriptional regulator
MPGPVTRAWDDGTEWTGFDQVELDRTYLWRDDPSSASISWSMSDQGRKRTTRYHSPLRARQAAQTRQTIVETALQHFSERGWAGTVLPMVASDAGVSVDTIFSTFGTKSALLMEAIEIAIVGDAGETAMKDREDFARLGQGRRAERLRAGVRYSMQVYARSVPMLRTLREAAASDERARARLAQYDQDRRELITVGMALILGHEPSPELVDGIWALLSPETYAYLVDGRGWSAQQAEDWFVDMAKAVIARG